MFSVRGVQSIALCGALMLACSSSANAQSARKEVREALFDACDQYSGKDERVCKRHARRTMQELAEEAKRVFKDCMKDGYGRNYCNELREASWEGNLVY